MNRRNLLVGAGAVAAATLAPCMPSIASYPKDYDKIMEVFTKTYDAYGQEVGYDECLKIIGIMVCEGVIDYAHVMHTPTEFVCDGLDTHAIVAKTRKFNLMDMRENAWERNSYTENERNSIVRILIEDNNFWMSKQRRMYDASIDMYYYMPVIAVKAIRQLGAPIGELKQAIGFKSRCGVSVSGRIETIEDERKRRIQENIESQYWTDFYKNAQGSKP